MTRTQNKYSSSLSMASVLVALAVAFQASTSNAYAVEITNPKAVVELFTSQGCSSCPPADAVLRKFNQGNDILGLAVHVDYWDYIGWKDTFGSKDNTQRQWNYAKTLGERQVYTPQAIINGRDHVVGSRGDLISEKAKEFENNGQGMIVPIRVSEKQNSIKIGVAKLETSKPATLYAFYFNPISKVEIKRGENAGKNIEYSNVVGKIEMIGMVGDNGLDAEFALADLKRKGFKGCALVLQEASVDGLPGAIIGASVLKDL